MDIIGSDFNMSAFREGGKSKLSPIEEACEKTFMTPPPGRLWRQLWAHSDNQERHKLTCGHAWKYN